MKIEWYKSITNLCLHRQKRTEKNIQKRHCVIENIDNGNKDNKITTARLRITTTKVIINNDVCRWSEKSYFLLKNSIAQREVERDRGGELMKSLFSQVARSPVQNRIHILNNDSHSCIVKMYTHGCDFLVCQIEKVAMKMGCKNKNKNEAHTHIH